MTIYRATKTMNKEEGDIHYWEKEAKRFYTEIPLAEIDPERFQGYYRGSIPKDWFKRLSKVYGLEIV